MARKPVVTVPQSADRRPVLEGKAVRAAHVAVEPALVAARISLRAPAGSIAALSKALGLKLPDKPCTSAAKGSRAALWLGPDEWLVIDAEGAELAAICAKAKVPHSAVDASHRNIGLLVSGKGAEATLCAGCPQDLALAAFPVGACSRTILGKIEVVIWRTGSEAFRVECWRSFAEYAFAFLADAARDAVA